MHASQSPHASNHTNRRQKSPISPSSNSSRTYPSHSSASSASSSSDDEIYEDARSPPSTARREANATNGHTQTHPQLTEQLNTTMTSSQRRYDSDLSSQRRYSDDGSLIGEELKYPRPPSSSLSDASSIDRYQPQPETKRLHQFVDHVQILTAPSPTVSDSTTNPGEMSPADGQGLPMIGHLSGALSPVNPELLREQDLPPPPTFEEEQEAKRLGLSTSVAAVVHDTHTDSDDHLHIPISAVPPAFSGLKGLKIPPLITGHVSSVTLPSRLALLGRKGFRILASISPLYVGNSVLGYAHVWNKDFNLELFLLPWIFSKSAARMGLFVRILFVLLGILFLIAIFGLATVNVGRVWVFGTCCALFVMYKLAQFRRAPDGVMAFCRSMGAPEVEEYMFSYSWKAEAENVRTLAKAVWETGVGVWIDTVKLCPGDEIRPMVRTMVHRVGRVIVFLSPAYCGSPNCAVEFLEAIQQPAKCLCCVVQDIDPSIIEFLEEHHIPIVYGFKELINALDLEVQDMKNTKALDWWRAQKIAGAGVPSNVVPKGWPIPNFSLTGRIFLSEKSLDVGPVYLQGDCTDSGTCVSLPYLFMLSVAGVGINTWDLINKVSNNGASTTPGDSSNDPTVRHSSIDYLWLFALILCNMIPFIAWPNLFETRRGLHVALKPLLASKSLGGGVKVRVVGNEKDPIVINLRKFLTLIGHLAKDFDKLTIDEAITTIRSNEVDLAQIRATTNPHLKHKDDGLKGLSDEQVLTVYVMDTIETRNALFGSEPFIFDRFSLFIWNGSMDCFTPDEIGKKLMRFLVLVAKWDKQLLAENLFSAVGVRVVDILHS